MHTHTHRSEHSVSLFAATSEISDSPLHTHPPSTAVFRIPRTLKPSAKSFRHRHPHSDQIGRFSAAYKSSEHLTPTYEKPKCACSTERTKNETLPEHRVGQRREGRKSGNGRCGETDALETPYNASQRLFPEANAQVAHRRRYTRRCIRAREQGEASHRAQQRRIGRVETRVP
jgi:hypothetical protein